MGIRARVAVHPREQPPGWVGCGGRFRGGRPVVIHRHCHDRRLPPLPQEQHTAADAHIGQG